MQQVKVESLTAHGVEENDGGGILVSLHGEWDIRSLEALRKVLGRILRRG